MLKRMMALLLCAVLFFSLIPAQAMAEEGQTEGIAPTEEIPVPTDPPKETPVPTEPVTEPAEPLPEPTVSDDPITIKWTQPNKLTYILKKESLDTTGCTLTLNYADNRQEFFEITPDMVTGFDNGTLGIQTLVASCGVHEYWFEVTVIEDPNTSVEPSLPAVPFKATVVTRVNVRSSPMTSSAALAVLEIGTQVEVLKVETVQNIQWALIDQGWVVLEYLEVDGDSSEPEIIASGECGENLIWMLDDEGTLTISGDGDMNHYSDYNEGNAAPWYTYRTQIQNVVIQKGVDSIGDYAFYECSASKIVIPETVAYAGQRSFAYCKNLKALTVPNSMQNIASGAFIASSLESIVLPEGITEIRADTFNSCRNLHSVTLPDTLESIGTSAFYECDALAEVKLPESVRIIGMSAFGQNESMKYITIPAGVQEIRPVAFGWNVNMEKITFEGNPPALGENIFKNVTMTACYPGDNVNWTSNVMQDYGGNITWVSGDGMEAEDPTVPTEPEEPTPPVETTPGDATEPTEPEVPTEPEETLSGKCGYDLIWEFEKQSGTLTISGKGNTIFDYTIDKPAPWSSFAANIKNITFNSNINTIGDYAFADCTGLTSVALPGEDYLSLGAGAFSGCANLTEIRFAGRLSHPVPEDVFSGVTAKAYYPAGYWWSNSDFKNYGGNLTWIEYGEDAVMLSFYTAYVKVGETYTSTVEAHPAKATADCTFTVSDPEILKIVTCDRKSITYRGMKPGRTTVTVTDQNTGLSVSEEVLVYDSEKITLPYTERILVNEEPFVRSYFVTPTETAKYVLMVTDINAPGWDSTGIEVYSDMGYASTVSWYWGEGIIRQIVELTAGTTYEIRVASWHPELGTTATIEFRKAEAVMESIKLGAEVIPAEVSEDDLEWVGVMTYPLDAYIDRSDIQWSIKDTDVAEIVESTEMECGFRAKKPGTTEITVSLNGFTDTATIHVYDVPILHLDETLELENYSGNMYAVRHVKFIPEEDGRYVFTVTGDGLRNPGIGYDYVDGLGNVQHGSDKNSHTLFAELKAGTPFTVRLDASPFAGKRTITVNKATDKISGMEVVCTYNTPDRVEFGVCFTPSTALEEVVKWEVSNPSLMGQSRGDGDPHNNHAYYTPYGTGRVTVTATSESGLTASCTIMVGQCLNGHRYSGFTPILDGLGNPTGEEYRTCYRCDTIEQRHIRPVATSGTWGDNLTWNFEAGTGTLIISGTGEMLHYQDAVYTDNPKIDGYPWHLHKDKITSVVVEEGVTSLAEIAFHGLKNLTSVTLPGSLNTIGDAVFAFCAALESVEIPENVSSIGKDAFIDGASLKTIIFTGNAPVFDPAAFGGVTATAYYPGEDTTWTSAVLQNYGGDITWVPLGEVENRLMLNGDAFSGMKEVWIDGVQYTVHCVGSMRFVDLPNANAQTMTAYEYHVDDPGDVHTQYPVSMKVWTLENVDGFYTAVRQTAYDDILQYAGMSIRVYGKKGIRMITSIDQNKKNALTGSGLKGYTLVEYGTVIAWADQLGEGNPLVLGKGYARSNYAYKWGVADPVFAYQGNLMQYTNVLVNFTNEQCKDDLAMRPYMVLKDAGGNHITIYGGIVTRSIGYIAYQNRNVFEPGTEEYEYVWEIIHYVYGNIYDDEYRKTWTPPAM